MKLITAIVRPDRVDDLVTALVNNGARGVTVTEVRGFGRQYGQLTMARTAAHSAERQVALLPKARLDLVVHDADAPAMVETIRKCAASGTIGDGKIWVGPLDGVTRVRTGEQDEAAI